MAAMSWSHGASHVGVFPTMKYRLSRSMSFLDEKSSRSRGFDR